MKVEGGEQGLLMEVLNEQFKIIGEKMTFEGLPDDGMIIVNGKKVRWYEYYRFTEEQDARWREWTWKKLQVLGEENGRKVMSYAELRYGFTIRYTKKGLLF